MTESLVSAFSASDSDSLSARLPCLGAQDVHLWLCSREHIASSDDFKRRVLSCYAAVAPSDWQFALNDKGKPSLAGGAHALDFNLSHSGDWLACAVTAGTPVGVDLEYRHSNRATMKVARRFFRPEEAVALQGFDEDQQRDRFYDFWTLKEAAVKARGEALVPGLQARGFALTFPAGPEFGRGRIVVTAANDADAPYYCLLDPLAAYRVAICWRPATPLLPQLQVFELCAGNTVVERIVPLRASSTID